MVTTQTETTDVTSWQQNWKIAQHHFPTMVLHVDPPGSCEVIEPREDVFQDIEDLEDGIGTATRYGTRGVEEFIPYRVYQRQTRHERQ